MLFLAQASGREGYNILKYIIGVREGGLQQLKYIISTREGWKHEGHNMDRRRKHLKYVKSTWQTDGPLP